MLSVVDTAPLVLDLGLVLVLAAAFGWGARRFRLPAVVGYMLVGLVVSPFTPGFVADSGQLTVLADIGVVLLLFEVGIEVDVRRIGREYGRLLWLVPLQLLGGGAIVAALLYAAGFAVFAALLLGLSVAMSSSVVVVNITRSRNRTTDPVTDETLLSWSVLQDIYGVAAAAVLLAVFNSGDRSLGASLAGLVGYAVFVGIGARILPWILRLIRWEHDIFLIFSVAAGLTWAAIGTVIFNVPMALAAFVAGLAINGGGDTVAVRTALLPFRDLFAVLFVVVVGSLVDLRQLQEALPIAAVLTLCVVVFKSGLIAVLARLAKLQARPLQLGVGLGQMGEFSFVLASVGVAAGVLTQGQFVGVLLTVVLTIVATTTLVRIGVISR